MKGVKAHTRYKTDDGVKVPGVTTVLGLLAKPQLIVWANRLGLEGIDSTKYVDKAARIGTCAHAMIESYLKSQPYESDQYSPDEVSQAENSLLKFYEWEKQVNLIPLESEISIVSNEHLFGGTIDCYAEIDGKKWLVDFKTGKATYEEHAYQLAAYQILLKGSGRKVDGCRIVRIGRDETEGFEDRVFGVDELWRGWKIFQSLLTIYYLKKGA